MKDLDHHTKLNPALLAYWLIPAEPHKTHFVALIRTFAERFDAATFEPHVTIYATHLTKPRPELGAFAQACEGIRPLTLHVHRIGFSNEFTKTLFIEFTPSGTLSSLSRRLKKLAPNPPDYALEPHLSLIYKTLSEPEKKSLADSIAIPFSEILFHEIKVITGNPTVTCEEDVASWKVVDSHRLS